MPKTSISRSKIEGDEEKKKTQSVDILISNVKEQKDSWTSQLFCNPLEARDRQ
jgi:hypothetical protein